MANIRQKPLFAIIIILSSRDFNFYKTERRKKRAADIHHSFHNSRDIKS
jgi:hypothetical protein